VDHLHLLASPVMPLIVLVGYPSSGKSKRAQQLREYLEDTHKKKVQIVSENELLRRKGVDKNSLCFEPVMEKEIRGSLKSETMRILSSDDVVILDAGNYIKGYRYELYCASKSRKTTQCTVECDISPENAWIFNEGRDDNEKYNREAFDALVARHEAPNYAARWDTPLITIQKDDQLPEDKIYEAIFKRKAPKPNQSTENIPVSSTYLHELDKVTKEIVDNILAEKRTSPGHSSIMLSDFDDIEISDLDDELDVAKLATLRRQFISYSKLRVIKNVNRDVVARLFIQFLKSSIQS